MSLLNRILCQKAVTSRRLLQVLVVAACALTASGWTQARSLQSVDSSIQSGQQIIRLDFDEPVQELPEGFVVQSPARIALDFPGVLNAAKSSHVEFNQGNLLSATVAQSGDRTRLVLNLKEPVNYNAEIQGNAVLIRLADRGGDTRLESPRAVFAESLTGRHANHVTALRDVDFRRGVDSSGRVVVELGSSQFAADLQRQGNKLVAEFANSSLPEGLRRRLDVSDFGTPVQFIETVESGNNVRMVIDSLGAWEHNAYQSDEQFVIEVRPQKVDHSKLTQGKGYQGERLSLNFQDIDVRSLLQVIADFTDFNIVTTDSVQGNLTLRLKDVPWDQALDIILDAKDLGVQRTGNVLKIAPKEEMAANEKAALEAAQAIRDLEPLVTQSYQLSYTKAQEVANQLLGDDPDGSSRSGIGRNNDNRLLSDRGSVIAEKRTNQLFVTDIPSRLAHVTEMISKLDIPVRQVLIEARIVEAADTFGRSLGVKLGAADLRGIRGGDPGWHVGGDNRVAIGGNYNAIGATTGQFDASGLNSVSSQFLNFPASTGDWATSQPANFAISLFSSAANRFLNLELSALEADGKGRVVSSPRVVTADQAEAIIKQGTEFPYQEATSSGATAVAFREAVLQLQVTPQITPEGDIILDLQVNKDTPGVPLFQGGEMPINTKQVKTQVLVENGGTVVIGGIFELNEDHHTDKVPLLGDIPALGNLFKSRTRSSTKEELLVFITPKIISEKGVIR